VGVILAAFVLLFGTLSITRFPTWLLWLIALWGLLHILGGAVMTPDGVLFAYRIYPFLDHGGDFYILKYDQLVHAYLYGVMALVFIHLIRGTLGAGRPLAIVALIALMASMGVSAMNEIMEFLIAVTLERNGVGGYENAMLDLIFNFGGALLATLGAALLALPSRS
jgi:putative membrane protein